MHGLPASGGRTTGDKKYVFSGTELNILKL
jgi:hypothetical protein